MATGRPAGTATDVIGVIHFADEEIAGLVCGSLHLDMALEAEIHIALHQQLAVDRSVGRMAARASFAHGFMFEDEGAGLFPMAVGALLVQARHGESARGFHDLVAVRIVALNAIHLALDDRVAVGEVELRVHIEVALKASRGILPGIIDEAAAAGSLNMLARGPVAGLAAGDLGEIDVRLVQLAVRTGGKSTGNICMAIDAR